MNFLLRDTSGYSELLPSPSSHKPVEAEVDELGISIHHKKGISTVFGASFNFVNSIVGAGIIGIPFALGRCGFYTGILLLASVAVMIYFSVTMLIECGLHYKRLDLEHLTEHALGKFGYYLSTTAMLVFAFGAQVAYTVVIGDTVPLVLEVLCPTCSESPLASRNSVILLTSTAVILPLCLLKDISSLSRGALFSIIAVNFLIVIVVIYSPYEAAAQHIPAPALANLSFFKSSVFGGVGTLSFAFVCQHNSFIVFRSLKQPTLTNWRLVAFYSVGLAATMCMTMGVMGYLSFQETTMGNVLNNFSRTDTVISIARLLLAINMVFTYPQECIVSRHCLLSLLHRAQKHIESLESRENISLLPNALSSSLEEVPEEDQMNTIQPNSKYFSEDFVTSPPSLTASPTRSRPRRLDKQSIEREAAADSILRIPVTILLWLSSVLIALYFLNLGVVLEITGSIAGSFLGYIIPSAINLKRWRIEKCENWNVVHLFLPIFMMLFGVVSMIAGLITVVIDHGA